MKTTPQIFDPHKGQLEKEKGMEEAEWHRRIVLGMARDLARHCALFFRFREITIDDVYRALSVRHINTDLLGPAAGSVFKGKEWEFTGKWAPSVRISNHGRMVRVWRLKKEVKCRI